MIEGKLHQLPLAEVFQIIVTSKKSGVLSILSKEKRARLFFEMGQVQYAYITPGVHLTEVMVRMELLTIFEAQGLQDSSPDNVDQLTNEALRQGFLDEDSLKRALKSYLTEILTDLLAWKTGDFQFNEKSLLVSQTPPEYSFDAMALLMEVLRRQDEWKRGIVKSSSIYKQLGNPTSFTLPEGSWEILGLLDGRRSSGTIAAELDMTENQVYRILFLLEQNNLVQLVPFSKKDVFALVLSKNQVLARLIRLSLKRIDVQPLLSYKSEDALSLVNEHRPRFVLVDKQGEESWQFVKDLRQMPGYSQIPVIMLEQEPESVGILKRWQRPKVITMQKPFEELDLQQLLSDLIGRQSV